MCVHECAYVQCVFVFVGVQCVCGVCAYVQCVCVNMPTHYYNEQIFGLFIIQSTWMGSLWCVDRLC